MNLPSTCGAIASTSTFWPARNSRGVFDPIDPGWFEINLLEPSRGELAPVLVLFQRSGYATNPQQHILANLGKHLPTGYNVGHREAPTRLENSECFSQNAIFVGRQVYDAVGNDDIDGVVRKRNVLDFTFQELGIFYPCLALVLVRQRQHLIGHIQTVDFACWPDSVGGEQNIDATA